MDGELHPLKYGSYFNDKEKLIKIIKAEEEFILNSPGEKNRRIWIDMYETNLDEELAEELVRHMINIKSKIMKICIVGCSKKSLFRKKLKTEDSFLFNCIEFFSVPEDAKMWLIGKK